jgi:hypothetical protein
MGALHLSLIIPLSFVYGLFLEMNHEKTNDPPKTNYVILKDS